VQAWKRLDISAEGQTINLPASIQAHECRQGVKSHFCETARSIASGSAALKQKCSKDESPDFPLLAVE